MDYLRQIEDDVRNIGIEAKSKYPLVKEASDRALLTLKGIRDSYVADIMKRNKDSSVRFPQSSDVLAPYMLACNYADCNPKLIGMALNGIHMLLNYGMIPPSDVRNILRVLSIQATSPRFDGQIKVLQILLHMASSLSHDPAAVHFLTESTICSFLTLALQVCDSKSSAALSVSATALGTVRQLVALILDGTLALFLRSDSSAGSVPADKALAFARNAEQAGSEFAISAVLLIRDLCLFVRGQPGDWIRGSSGAVAIPQSFALELLHEVLDGWKLLFLFVPSFRSLLDKTICPAIRPLLQGLQDDFLAIAARSGLAVASAFTSRVVRVARSVLLHFSGVPEMHGHADYIITVLLHALHPDRGGSHGGVSLLHLQAPQAETRSSRGSSSPGVYGGSADLGEATLRSRLEDASSFILPGGAAIMSRITAPVSTAINNIKGSIGGGGGTPGGSISSQAPPSRAALGGLSGLAGLYLTVASSAGPSSNYSPADGLSSGAGGSASLVPAHPAALCLETLLAFLAGRDQLTQLQSENALDLVGKFLVDVSVGVAGLLYSALGAEANARDLEAAARGCPLHGLLRALLAGEDGGVRAVHEHLMSSSGARPAEVLLLALALLQMVPRTLFKGALCVTLHNNAPPNEQQLKQIAGAPFISTALRGLVPLGKEEAAGFLEWNPRIRAMLARVCDNVYERNIDACSQLLSVVDNAAIVRSALGMVSELALSAGLLGLGKPCEISVSWLCRYTVPVWHGQEMHTAGMDAPVGRAASALGPVKSVRWRHLQAIVRLLQVVHVLADVLTDWDCVVDSLEQLVHHFGTASGNTAAGVSVSGGGLQRGQPGASQSANNRQAGAMASGGGTKPGSLAGDAAVDVDRVFGAVERFKAYSVFLSDEALVKLMTSLVALSMNSLAVSATITHSGTSADQDVGSGYGSGSSNSARSLGGAQQQVNAHRLKSLTSDPACPEYLLSGVRSGAITFSLQTVIEVTKLNAFRVSAVWQMVTSHLRMIASLKSPAAREVSVAATHDVILTSLRYLQSPVSPVASLVFMKEEPATEAWAGAGGVLSDEVVYGQVLPKFETVFVGRDMHRLLSFARNQVLLYSPKLSQGDLLSSLRSLATVRYADVRGWILSGLAQLLQERGQSLDGEAWLVILSIVEAVPASMAAEGFLAECRRADDSGSQEEDDDGDEEECTGGDGGGDWAAAQHRWPRECLSQSFTVMKLVVDEFLQDALTRSNATDVVRAVLRCLSVFCSQSQDVNVSLTAVEMLWKVTDCAITAARHNVQIPGALREAAATTSEGGGGGDGSGYVEGVFDALLKKLFVLSMDPRPEVRHCAMNTLFSAMANHAEIIGAAQWRQVFVEIIFPLFERTGARSRKAMRSGEEAIAPQLEKGVRMNVHHSRDTAQKQWAETRVLALRSLTRVMRTSARLLVEEPWFARVWADSVSVCHGALQSACEDLEVAVAGLEVVVSMLRVVVLMDAAATPLSTTTAAALSTAALTRKGQANGHRSSGSAVASDAQVAKEKFENLERCKAALWTVAWTALHDCAFFSCASAELAFAVAQKLAELYRVRADHEFRYGDNVRVLFEIVVTLARPRLAAPGQVVDLVAAKQNRVAESQLQRALMDILRDFRHSGNTVMYSLLLSALAEVCFASRPVQVLSPLTGEILILGPAPDRLRAEAAEHLALMQQSVARNGAPAAVASTTGAVQRAMVSLSTFPVHAAPAILDTVVRSFAANLCAGPLSRRCISAGFVVVDGPLDGVALEAPPSPSTAAANSASSSGFFSFFGSATSPSPSSSGHGTVHPAPVPRAQKPRGVQHSLHAFAEVSSPVTLQSATVALFSGAEAWRSFYCLGAESQVLLQAVRFYLQHCGASRSPADQLAPAAWQRLLLCLSCASVPWRTEELSAAASVPTGGGESSSDRAWDQLGEMAANARGVVDGLFQWLFAKDAADRTLVHYRPQFLAVLADSTALGVAAMAGQSAEGAQHYLAFWQQSARILAAVVAGDAHDSALRSRALTLLVHVTATASEAVAGAASPGPEVLAACRDLLQATQQVDSSGLHVEPTRGGDTGSQESGLHVHHIRAWLSSVYGQAERAEGGGSADSPSRREASSPNKHARTTVSSAETRTEHGAHRHSAAVEDSGPSSHLILLLPACVELVVRCTDQPIREAAADLIKRVDLQRTVSRVRQLAERNAHLEASNRELRAELLSVKSAASLPF